MNKPKPKTEESAAPASEIAKRISAIFHRQILTKWSAREIKSFKALRPFNETELALVERYYRVNWPPSHGKNILRHDLATFLNNYPGEVDRARIWCEKHQLKQAPRKIIPLPRLPEQEMTEGEQARAEAEFEKLMGRKPKLRWTT